MFERRTLQSWAYRAVAVVGALPILFLPRIIFHGTPPGGGAVATAVTIASLAAGLAWASWFAIASFRRADEFVRERSKFAWYWGSLIGIVVAVLIFGLIALGGLPWVVSGRDAIHGFKLGMLLPIAAQLLGFFAMSAWWRATKR